MIEVTEGAPGGWEFMCRLAAYNSDDKLLLSLGFIAALVNGTLLPLFALFLGEIIGLLLNVNARAQTYHSLYFFIIGLAILLFNFFQYGLFYHLSEKVTLKLRSDIFRKLMSLPMSFYQDPRNSVGKVTEYLFSDSVNCNRLTSTFIAMNIQNVSSLLTGLIIAFAHSWQVSLVSLGLVPFMILASLIAIKVMSELAEQVEEYYRSSSGTLSEYIRAIKTVKALGREVYAAQLYEKAIEEPMKMTTTKGFFGGLFFGIAQLLFFLVIGSIFLASAAFLDNRVIQGSTSEGLTKVMVTIFAILFGATPIGYYAQFMPDLASGRNSANRIFRLLDQEAVESQKGGEFPSRLESLAFEHVAFQYPRKETFALDDVSFSLQRGQKLALTGPSGSGKSTVVQLLLRMYDCHKGSLRLNGSSIEKISRKALRMKIGLIAQEPVLFNCSLRENIVYNSEPDE
jgi:ATP-binding cassette subfamily B (MDR/TAP) protein 1